MRYTLLVLLVLAMGGAALADGPQPFDPGMNTRHAPSVPTIGGETSQQAPLGVFESERSEPAVPGPFDDEDLYLDAEFEGPMRTGTTWIVDWSGGGADYTSIQQALADTGKVLAGDTLLVKPGTYVEVGQIVIDRNLTIRGENPTTTIVKTDQNTDASGDAQGWWLVNSGVTLDLWYLTLDGSGKNVRQAIRSWGSGTIAFCEIKNMYYSKYIGWGVVLFGNMTVRNCSFSDIERIGVQAFGTDSTSSIIMQNTYVGKGAIDCLDYAIEVGGGAQAMVAVNRISDCLGVALSDGSNSGGILATDYYGSGTHADIMGNTVTNCTVGVFIGYGTGDATTADVHYNSLAGNVSYGLDSVSTMAIDAEDNWWGDRSGPYDAVGNLGGLGDAVYGSLVDYNPWLLYPQVHLAFGGARLVGTQNDDGGWDWPLDSAPNTIGPIGMGLCRAYRATLDPDMFTALGKVETFLQNKTNNFSPPDGYLAYELDTILGGTTNRDHVTTYYYGPLAAGTYNKDGGGDLYDTEGYVQLIRDSRETQGYPNLAAWDIGMGLVAAHACGADTYEWIEGVKAEIDELDPVSGYETVGLAGAIYGLAYVGEDYTATDGWCVGKDLGQMAGVLVTLQVTETGGFAWDYNHVIPYDANESVQYTGYAILALNAVGGYKAEILSAIGWIDSMQLSTGGWMSYIDSSSENNEITAEGLWGLSAANLLALNPDADALYIKPGEYAWLYMDVSNLQQLVTGCQAMLNFNSTYFDWTTVYVEEGDVSVWSELIYYVCDDSDGDLDVAVGVKIGAPATEDDGTVAKVRLTANAGVEGITRMVFRPDVHPDPYLVESTFFSDEDAQPVWPNRWDSHTIVIDKTAPCVEDLAAIQDQPYVVDVNVLDGTNPAVQGSAASGTAVEITVMAEDSYLVGIPLLWSTGGGDLKLTHTDTSTTLDAVYAGKTGLHDYMWTVDIDETAKNGQYNFSITAEDMAGWQTTVSGYIVVSKNQITGTVEMDTFLAAGYGFYRDVVFKATDSGGNVLETWTVNVHFTNDAGQDAGKEFADGTYTLTDVPDGTENLSAKTAWSLREKKASALDSNGEAVTHFMGVQPAGDRLRGGDLNESNSVNILDYSILRAHWGDPGVADVNGNGTAGITDYSIMKLYWFQAGEAE